MNWFVVQSLEQVKRQKKGAVMVFIEGQEACSSCDDIIRTGKY